MRFYRHELSLEPWQQAITEAQSLVLNEPQTMQQPTLQAAERAVVASQPDVAAQAERSHRQRTKRRRSPCNPHYFPRM